MARVDVDEIEEAVIDMLRAAVTETNKTAVKHVRAGNRLTKIQAYQSDPGTWMIRVVTKDTRS